MSRAHRRQSRETGPSVAGRRRPRGPARGPVTSQAFRSSGHAEDPLPFRVPTKTHFILHLPTYFLELLAAARNWQSHWASHASPSLAGTSPPPPARIPAPVLPGGPRPESMQHPSSSGISSWCLRRSLPRDPSVFTATEASPRQRIVGSVTVINSDSLCLIGAFRPLVFNMIVDRVELFLPYNCSLLMTPGRGSSPGFLPSLVLMEQFL